MNKPNPVPSPTYAALRADYVATVEKACAQGDRPELEAMIWDRLYRHKGPPIDHLRNEEPVSLLKWVLSALTTEAATRLGRAAFDLFCCQLHQVPSNGLGLRTVRALSDLAELLEVVQEKGVALGPGKVEGLLKELVANDCRPSLAASLYASETPRGDRLLSDVLRVLALFTDAAQAGTWRDLLTAHNFDQSVLPAFMGYCRATGESAHDALPLVARALALRDRPDTLAVALKAFATAAYSDRDYRVEANALTVGDFSVLFREIPAGAQANFADRTFAALGELGFHGELLPTWRIAAQAAEPDVLFQRLLVADVGNDAIPIFKVLAWALGRDARIGLPLVARSLAGGDRPGGALAGLLRSFHDGSDFDGKRLQRENRSYRRLPLDVGDFYTMFALVPPADKAVMIEETFAALKQVGFESDRLEAWAHAARTPLTGVLADGIDSLLFADYPALHALLLSELAATDPLAYHALVSLYVKEPLRMFAPRLSQLAMEYAPADRFLYAPGPVLKPYVARFRAAALNIPIRLVVPGGESVAELAPASQDVLPQPLPMDDEGAVLSLLMRGGAGGGAEEAARSAAGFLNIFDRGIHGGVLERSAAIHPGTTITFQQQTSPGLPVGREALRARTNGTRTGVSAGNGTTALQELLADVHPPALRSPPFAPAKTYHLLAGQQIDAASLWAWLLANLDQLLGVQNGLPQGVYRDSSTGALSIDCQTIA